MINGRTYKVQLVDLVVYLDSLRSSNLKYSRGCRLEVEMFVPGQENEIQIYRVLLSYTVYLDRLMCILYQNTIVDILM